MNAPQPLCSALRVLICAALLFLSVAQAQQCKAPEGGATCGGAGPASQGNTSGTNTGAGNPINLTNGNKYQIEVDLPALPGELGLEIVRHYNSTHRFVIGQLGMGWRLSYETDLYVVGQTLQILQADGARLVFNIDPRNPSLCAGADPAQGHVQILTSARGTREYVWHWSHGENAGRRLRFDDGGKLVQITAASGAVLSIARSPKGELLKVTDPQGRSLSFNHGGPGRARQVEQAQQRQASAAANGASGLAVFTGIQSIDSPVGRFAYEHGVPSGSTTPEALARARAQAANLTQVSLPTHVDSSQRAHAFANRPSSSSTLRRQYHYEDARHPLALTGISVLGAGSDGLVIDQRLSTYQYNERAQATLSVRGEPASGVEKVQVQILQPARQSTQSSNPPGQTLLTNSLGQQTLYTHQIVGGQYRLLQAVGAGCAQCGPVNLRWGYDALGRMIEQTELSPGAVVDGQPQGNPQPLLSTRHTLDAQGRTQRIEQTAFVNGKAQTPRLIERHEYADTRWPDKPTLISRASVVPGQEHRIALTYNDAGQVLELKETGYSPLDTQGEVARTPAQASRLERTTTHTYTRINGRSLLTRVDGPLPNGPSASPADSDVTEFAWDERGRHIHTVHFPGGMRNDITLDASTGLLERVVNEARFETRFTYNPQLQLTHISSQGPGWAQAQAQSFQYDALGLRVQSFQGNAYAGDQTAESARPTERQGFDAQGRLLWKASALGMLHTWQYDTEGQLLQSARLSSTMAQRTTLSYDDLGRPIGMSDNAGRRRGLRYGTDGLPDAYEDALGRQVHARRSAERSISAPSIPALRPMQAIDDFGRQVLTLSPDAGTTRRSFDAADRLVSMTDAQGHQATYAYDAQGRILSQRITDARTQAVTPTEWRYNTRHLLEVIYPTQREHFETDARGLRTARIVTMITPQGEHTAITRYEHDAQGQLVASTLPDGSRLVYERNGQNQVVALKRQTIQTPWLRWLGREQTLANDFERDLVGLRSYTSGNGIQALHQRSSSGDLARVVYRHTQARPAQQARLGNATTLLGRSTQETIERLLGIQAAHAQTAAPAPAADQPGALATPTDPQALIDHRYLWSAEGHLLHSQQRAGPVSEQTQHSHAYDAQGRLVASVQANLNESAQEQGVWRYAFDAHQRRVLSQQGAMSQTDLSTGTQRSQFQDDSHRLNLNAQPTAYNTNGQPERVGRREFVWDALGRLTEVREEAMPRAQYRYDHRGLRISKTVGPNTTHTLYDESRQPLAELDAQGRITRQYVWLADMPLAVIDSEGGTSLASEAPALAMVWADLRRTIESWLSSDAGLAWLHTNHLGAPEAATNAQGQFIWRARYAPFGAAQVSSTPSAFTLHLRLPGQLFDAETGLHYNRQRYYDPEHGQYLTPDPLGTPDGPNPYAYVAFNPLGFVDPDGLVLFAFDGTENGDPPLGNSTASNVARFRDAYNDGNRQYVSGVGTDHQDVEWGPIQNVGLDAAVNRTGTRRIERMMVYFLEEMEQERNDNTMLNIDIIGFSRGAAQARDFANNIIGYTGRPANGDVFSFQTDARGWFTYSATVRNAAGENVQFQGRQCVNLRFMGLWDTVLSTNSGRDYRLGIPAQFQYVAHAVALNEYRSQPFGGSEAYDNGTFYNSTRTHLPGDRHWGGFPLQSIGASSSRPGQVRIERGFIGAHADIGGGYGANENGLSTVALSWMVAQAQSAWVNMKTASIRIDMNNPVVHDQSHMIRFGDPRSAPGQFTVPSPVYGTSTYRPEDRQVIGAVSGTTQRAMGFGATQDQRNRSLVNAETHGFISYSARDPLLAGAPRTTNSITDIVNLRNRTGSVDMQRYMEWLRGHGYTFAEQN